MKKPVSAMGRRIKNLRVQFSNSSIAPKCLHQRYKIVSNYLQNSAWNPEKLVKQLKIMQCLSNRSIQTGGHRWNGVWRSRCKLHWKNPSLLRRGTLKCPISESELEPHTSPPRSTMHTTHKGPVAYPSLESTNSSSHSQWIGVDKPLFCSSHGILCNTFNNTST